MAGDFSRDLDTVGRCPPYGTLATAEPHFLASPHLTLLLVNKEHLRALLPGERIMTSPPEASLLRTWLDTGDPESYCGPLVISWVFFRHMSLKDEQGCYTYSPRLFARIILEGQEPVITQMDAAWHERANTTMALSANNRTVHHIPLACVQRYLRKRGNVDVFVFPNWDFELLTMEEVLHPNCLRASCSLLVGALIDPSTAKRSDGILAHCLPQTSGGGKFLL
jgi:hypothetical protein